MKKFIYLKLFIGLMIIVLVTSVVLIIKPKGADYSFNLESSPLYRQKIKDKDLERVVIYEFSDFSCPACKNMHFYLKELVEYFPYIKITFKHYPLTEIHPYALKASLWAECAGIKYSKFWEFADLLFKEREKWSNNPEHEKIFEGYAKSLSMDIKTLRECSQSLETKNMVKRDMEEGERLGIDSTPTFFINGKKAVGGMELIEKLKEIIK